MRACDALVRLMVCAAWLAASCTAYRAPNDPLARWDRNYGYRPATRHVGDRPFGDVLLLLAFSGGGTRAAALSYGVLEELRDTRIGVGGSGRRLLDEVDLISAVSGGSFSAAYYGLHGDRIFGDFEDRMLRRDLERPLLGGLLNPIHWIRGATSFFSPTEMAVALYDDEIFDGATFADLAAADGPFVEINAADLATGSRFAFDQPQFDLLCSNLSTLRVARAVTASSAVPGIFPPLTLRNYAGSCGFEPPAWLEAALGDRRPEARRRLRAAAALAGYLDPERPYVHLVDGGIADNLGVRGPLENVMLVGGITEQFIRLGAQRPRALVVVAVNAEVHPAPTFSLSAATPSLPAIVDAVSNVGIHSYNFETLELLRESLRRWAHEVPPDEQGRPLDTYVVEIAFESIGDADERRYMYELPTSLALDDEQVDRLIAVGRRLLSEAPEFRALVSALNEEVPRE